MQRTSLADAATSDARRNISRVSIAEAAAFIPCSTKTIRRRIADGSLSAVRFGRKILVDLDELEGLLKPVSAATEDGAA